MAELVDTPAEKNSLEELLNDVNSMLEEGECTPSEILSDPLGPDDSFEFDELNEGDDENSDFEITGKVIAIDVGCQVTQIQWITFVSENCHRCSFKNC